MQLGRASPIEATLSNTPFQPVSLPPPANAPYSRWAGCHFFRVLPRKGQGCGPRARKQVSTTTEPSPFRAAGQRRLQTERSKPPGTNAPGISAPASSPPLSETGWLQLGRASPIEAALSNTPFQPVSLPPPANAPYSRWAGCHFFRVLPRKGQGCGPRARKQVSTTTEPSPFRAAGQRRLQTERSKPPGTNAPGISDPASSPPVRKTGGCNWGALLQLKPPFPTRLSSPSPCHPLQMRHTTAGRDATSSASCPAKVRVAAHGPESRFPPQQSLPFSGLRASVGFKPNAPSFTARTRRGISDPASGKARRRFTMPCGYATFFLDPFHISKRTGPIRYCPAEKSNASNHTGFPMPRTSAPCFFLDLRGRSMPHMTISYIYEQREGEGEPFPKAR